MKRMFVLAIVLALLTGCASNQAIKQQKQKVWELETNLEQQKTELVVLRKEIMQNRKGGAGSYSNSDLDSLMQEVKAMAAFQNSSFKDVTTDVKYLMEKVVELADEQYILREDFDYLQADNDEILSGFAERLGSISTSDGDKVVTPVVPGGTTVTQLSKTVEDNDKSLRSQIAALEARISELQKQIDAKPASNKPAIAEKQVVSKEAPEGMIQEYEAARMEYEKGKYQLARDKFAAFIGKYPSSQYLGNALYWTGESYYAEGNFTNALREFQTIISRYPDSWKAPDAQLKIGVCYHQMGNSDAARKELELVRTNYPKYQRMDLVDRFLKQIK